MPDRAHLSRALVTLLAIATGLAVAGLYYSQPLLTQMRSDLHLHGAVAGLVVTVSQLGYAAGLVFLLPLGDLFERRRLIAILFIGAAVALGCFALASSAWELLGAAALVGLLSTVAQILVPTAATLAADDERGKVLGTVMGGLLIGILVARTAAGYLAELGGWRTVYWVSAGLMISMAIALRLLLPRYHAPAGLNYPALLQSVVRLLRDESVLRLRSVYGAIGFAAFSVLWTSITFLLSGAPYHYSTGTIGLFGLIGAAGALAANAAGRLADGGRVHITTGVAALLLAISWVPIALAPRSLAALIIGVVLLDLAVQGLHISNQSEIYRLRPEARARLTSAYMTIYFLGGVVGSAASTFVYNHDGWSGCCLLGGGFGLLATALWLFTLVRPVRARSWVGGNQSRGVRSPP
jgi:predicted MFS family arabinose efflux permease